MCVYSSFKSKSNKNFDSCHCTLAPIPNQLEVKFTPSFDGNTEFSVKHHLQHIGGGGGDDGDDDDDDEERETERERERKHITEHLFLIRFCLYTANFSFYTNKMYAWELSNYVNLCIIHSILAIFTIFDCRVLC